MDPVLSNTIEKLRSARQLKLAYFWRLSSGCRDKAKNFEH